MNIFIMVLVFLFVAGYYFMDSPSQRVQNTELTQAVNTADLRSITECASLAQTAVLRNLFFEDVCVQQYEIKTQSICMNDKQSIVKCEVVKNRKPEYSFIITSTAPIIAGSYNSILEIIERDYPNAGTFGIFLDNVIMGGGPAGKRPVPLAIIKAANLEPGQLVYMTQYEVPDIETEYIAPMAPDIKCGGGTVKAYRFGRWQCIARNTKENCSGDRIWDSDLQECVADNSRKPLCAMNQTAVMVDDVWECVDPFLDRECGTGYIARLNYNTLEWECVEDPNTTKKATKCLSAGRGAYGAAGGTLRITTSYCTDCEETIVDPDTCAVKCVPSPSKINDKKCYPATGGCSGANRAFYFGFPSSSYAANITAVSGYKIPFDILHSQNRKFNCLDCGERGIDNDKSLPPYIAVCE